MPRITCRHTKPLTNLLQKVIRSTIPTIARTKTPRTHYPFPLVCVDMDKLPPSLRAKFLAKKAAANSTPSTSTSGTTTPLASGTESQVFTPTTSTTPNDIPFPTADLETCLACDTPCTPDEHGSYPNYIVKSIDRELPLAGSVKPYGRHILISTGRTDWVHSIDEENGSVAQGVHRGLYDKKFGGRKRDGEERIVLSNTSFAPRKIGSGVTEVVLMPEWKLVRGVTTKTTSALVAKYIDGVVQRGAIDIGGGGGAGAGGLEAEKLPFHSCVLICSHAKRDKRCGVTSKYLLKAFESGL